MSDRYWRGAGVGARYQATIADIAFGINNKGKVIKFASARLGKW